MRIDRALRLGRTNTLASQALVVGQGVAVVTHRAVQGIGMQAALRLRAGVLGTRVGVVAVLGRVFALPLDALFERALEAVRAVNGFAAHRLSDRVGLDPTLAATIGRRGGISRLHRGIRRGTGLKVILASHRGQQKENQIKKTNNDELEHCNTPVSTRRRDNCRCLGKPGTARV